jgi:NADH:ubiquinone oxidoreductase subunit F (NADH-binding)
VINNVETLANIPHIVLKGAKWFRSIGVDGSFGTKLFSITGNVNNSGVFEVELGKHTLRDLIYGLAKGVEDGRKLKALQPGGPSTCFISSDNLDVVMDYKSLDRAGSSLGTGTIIVLDETVSIPELVKHFFDYWQKESCGDCVPCRLGTKKIDEILYWITEPMGPADFQNWHRFGGPAKMSYIEILEDIGKTMKIAAKCGFGQAAPQSLLSSIKLFGNEYRSLIAQRQAEYERFVKQSSGLSNGATKPVRSILRRIDL